MKKVIDALCSTIKTAKWWLVAQLFLTPVLLLLGVVLLRIPDAKVWQFVLSVLLALILLGAFLWLQAGTLRSLVGGEKKTRFFFAAIWIICCGLLAWIAYNTATHYEDQFDLVAGYLNSRLPAGRFRAAWLTREHISTFFTWVEWLIIWLGIPGLLIPIAAVASVDGVKLPSLASINFFTKKRWWLTLLLVTAFVFFSLWSKLPALILFAALGLLLLDWKSIRSVWCNWRWWPVVLLCAYAWTHWMLRAFEHDPYGSVRAQQWAVVWKTLLAYGIGIFCWVAPLVWVAVLLARSFNKNEGFDQSGKAA